MKPASPMIAFSKLPGNCTLNPAHPAMSANPAWSARHPRRAATRLHGPGLWLFSVHIAAHSDLLGQPSSEPAGLGLRTACVDLTAIEPAPGLRACSHHG